MPAQLSLAVFNSRPLPPPLSEPLFCLASSGTGTQAQELGDLGFSPSSAINSLSLPCFGLQSPQPYLCKSHDFSGLQVSLGGNGSNSLHVLGINNKAHQALSSVAHGKSLVSVTYAFHH